MAKTKKNIPDGDKSPKEAFELFHNIMKASVKGNPKRRLSFQYNFNAKNYTTVEFELAHEGGQKVAKNISLKSNWRSNYPDSPVLMLSNNEWGFLDKGVFITNGDIQQMIKRIFQIVNQSTHKNI